MRMLRLSCVIAVFCFASIATPAQQATASAAPPVTNDPQAVALIQRALAALTGGVPVSDVTLTGTALWFAGSDNETGTASLMATSAADSLVNLAFSSGNRREIRNHFAVPLPGTYPANSQSAQVQQGAGAYSGTDGVLHPIVPHNLFTTATWFFPAYTLSALLTAPNYTLNYVGTETQNGVSVVHVSAVRFFPGLANDPGRMGNLLRSLSQMDIYIDPNTSLPVSLVFNIHPDVNAFSAAPVQIQFSNYQAVNGVLIPEHIQRYVNNGLSLDIQISSVTMNSGLSSTLFQLQ
jgi:hypothetical protein